MTTIIPRRYRELLDVVETEKAIKYAKDWFEKNLADNLSLTRVSAPLFVDPLSGLNDNLNGVERPVSFEVKAISKTMEIVHSLAKWKRMALGKYRFKSGTGLYTDMNAIRRDEDLDNLHSIYVDQWDWERVIDRNERTIEYLKATVRKIVKALAETKRALNREFPELTSEITEEVTFITSEELLERFPNLSSKERENEICKLYKTVFVIGIGGKLNNGCPHDLRAPDYDDWQLNGDILVWYEPLQMAVELSSMGIRVDKDSLLSQLEKANCIDRIGLPYHQDVIYDRLPLTIGGGIGQSRLCLVMLEKIHIGEVQVSVWPKNDLDELEKAGVNIL